MELELHTSNTVAYLHIIHGKKNTFRRVDMTLLFSLSVRKLTVGGIIFNEP